VPDSHEHTGTSIASTTSDESLLEKFLLGDDRAYVRLYERYDKSVLTYLRTVLREHIDVADDLFQECFVRLFRERARKAEIERQGNEYTPVKNMRGWIFRVAHNLAISYLRSLRQNVSLSDEENDLARWDERLMVPIEESFAQLYGEEDALAGEELHARLRACIDLLPRTLREVYVLREINGLEYEEVAAAVGCTQEAARMRISRARSALRKALGKG
jgi:RNA polymerase sigma-70 factor (ECF subfamily)